MVQFYKCFITTRQLQELLVCGNAFDTYKCDCVCHDNMKIKPCLSDRNPWNTFHSLTFDKAPGSVLFKAPGAEAAMGQEPPLPPPLPSQFFPSRVTWKPALHTQWKLPSVLMQRPLLQIRPFCRHSSMSEVKMKKKKKDEVNLEDLKLFFLPPFPTLILDFSYLIISITVHVMPNNRICGIISIRKIWERKIFYDHTHFLLRLLRPQLYEENRVSTILSR